jgi:hypothetical protein
MAGEMVESSSSAVPGDVEWLPGPGGSRVLRIPANPEPPTLILRVAEGVEERIEAGPGPHTEFAIPDALDWSTAVLQWPDGTRATVPPPHGPHAEVIELRPRRVEAADARAEVAARDAAAASGDAARGETVARDAAAARGETAARDGAAASGDAARGETAARDAAAPSGDAAHGEAAEADTGPVLWTTPPEVAEPAGADAEALWQSRRDELGRELAEAAAAIARAREGERSARDAVLAALAAARADLRASRAARAADASVLAALTGELDAERSAHAVTRGSIGTLADALASTRLELAATKASGTEAHAGLAGARAEAAALRAALDSERDARTAAEVALRETLDSERAARFAAEAALRETVDTERAARVAAETALREQSDRSTLLARVADLDRHAAGLRDQVAFERRAREQAEAAAAVARRPPEESARLLANLDAAAAALRATVKPPADGAPAEGLGRSADAASAEGLGRSADAARAEGLGRAADAAAAPAEGLGRSADAAAAEGLGRSSVPAPFPSEGLGRTTERAPAPAEALRRATDPAPAVELSTELVAPGSDARLRHALVAFAREDAMAAGALLVGLLPAQAAVLEGSLSYDLTVRGVGTFAVFMEDGSARVIRLSRRRPRGEALFHLSADPVVLAELLAGDRRKVGRLRRKARLTGNRKRGHELLALQEANLSLADAVRAGARLEPALIYKALPFAIDPEWTKGHNFTVAQQIVELAPQAWHITVRDGQPLRIVERNSGTEADATVTMSRAAFDRLLREEPPEHGDRPVIRGDRNAVAALKRWTDLAR